MPNPPPQRSLRDICEFICLYHPAPRTTSATTTLTTTATITATTTTTPTTTTPTKTTATYYLYYLNRYFKKHNTRNILFKHLLLYLPQPSASTISHNHPLQPSLYYLNHSFKQHKTRNILFKHLLQYLPHSSALSICHNHPLQPCATTTLFNHMPQPPSSTI